LETLDIAAPERAASAGRKARPALLTASAPPSYADATARWPGWARLALLLGASLGLWGGLFLLARALFWR